MFALIVAGDEHAAQQFSDRRFRQGIDEDEAPGALEVRQPGGPAELFEILLGDGPYYAVELHFGCLGTKGGPLVNEKGQVLDTNDRPLPGLYACGNVAASVFGPGYPGAGSTLAAGMAGAYTIGRVIGS